MSKTKRALAQSHNGNSNGNGHIYKNRLEDLLNGQSKDKDTKVITLKNVLRSRTPNQRMYVKTIQQNDVTFCTGPAGSGKTHLAIGAAATYLSKGLVDRIILIRPTISCDEELGFFPGDLSDKLGPYLRPVFDELFEFFTTEQIHVFTSSKPAIIEGVPLGIIKGRTFKRSFIVIDECQDATYKQIKNALTRIGDASKIVVNGDVTQTDRFTVGQITPMEEIIRKLEGCQGIGFSQLDPSDNQRHPCITRMLERI